MTIDQFFVFLTYGIYGAIFCVVTVKAVRRPVRATLDTFLLFACPVLIIALSLAGDFDLLQIDLTVKAVSNALLIAMCYMLLRLVDDFSVVPAWLMRVATALLVVCVVALLVFAAQPTLPVSFEILFGVALVVYTAVAFITESRRSRGVTKRRMNAVAFGSLSLCALLVAAGVVILAPPLNSVFGFLAVLAILASAIGYYLGFATPGFLRRTWQEPDLRAFLQRVGGLPNMPSMEMVCAELEHGTASSVGATEASIGLWDENRQALRFRIGGKQVDLSPSQSPVGEVFESQQAVFVDNTTRNRRPTTDEGRPTNDERRQDNPRSKMEQTAIHSVLNRAGAALIAPVTVGGKRLGVLSVYADRSSIFAEEDLSLVQLLANQAAVILESRALIDTAARVKAREEVARLKEDFLSAAAHDLKTPISTIMLQVELLERTAQRLPKAPADLVTLQRLKMEIYRLETLMLELLDVARAEQGKLVGRREPVDLVGCAQEVCARHSTDRHACTVQAGGPVVGLYDPNRMVQLIENLVENAVKYSPDGGPVRLHIWHEPEPLEGKSGSEGAESGGWNHLTITDSGIGIPKEDIPYLFERFHRGSNVNDKEFAGMGLGLFICRGIVEQHGGKIWVESVPSAPLARHDNSLSKGAANGDRYVDESNNGGHDSGEGGTDAAISNTKGSTFHVVLAVLPPVTPADAPTTEVAPTELTAGDTAGEEVRADGAVKA